MQTEGTFTTSTDRLNHSGLRKMVWEVQGQAPVKATIVRINEFGLCEVTVISESLRAAFTLDKIKGYGGQPLGEFGIRVGAQVEFIEDRNGRIQETHVVNAAVGA